MSRYSQYSHSPSSTRSQGSSGSSVSIWDSMFGDDEDNDFYGDPDENPKLQPWELKDAIVFLIDCCESMFEANESGEIPFVVALRCVVSVLSDKIISNDHDLVAVSLFGCRAEKNPNKFPGIFNLQELGQPSAETYGIMEDFRMVDAFWNCSTLFQTSTKVGSKRIFLFTSEDNPNDFDAHSRDQAIQRARDLRDLNITIELFPLKKLGYEFDFTKFYQDVLSFDEDDYDGILLTDPTSRYEELITRIRRKEFKKRSLGRLTLSLNGDHVAGDTGQLGIGMNIYNRIQSTNKGSYVPLDRRTNHPLTRETKYICEETTALLLPYQILSGFDYGGVRVDFEKEELTKIKVLYKPGFKSMSSLKFYYNLKHASFVYPDESYISGSTVAFAALLDRMLALKKYAVCRLTARSNASPRLCALLPQRLRLDADGGVLFPDGFNVILLPFADDIRQPEIPENPDVDRDQVLHAKKLISSMTIQNFDSRNFENPALQHHYNYLQAVALERDFDEPVEDTINPPEEIKELEPVILSFRDSVFPIGYISDPKKTPRLPAKTRKRTRIVDNDDDDDNDEPRAKRRRTTSTRSGPIDWEGLAAADKLHTLRVPELREYCTLHGIVNFTKLKKADLVALVSSKISASQNSQSIDPPSTSHSLAPSISSPDPSSSSVLTPSVAQQNSRPYPAKASRHIATASQSSLNARGRPPKDSQSQSVRASFLSFDDSGDDSSF